MTSTGTGQSIALINGVVEVRVLDVEMVQVD